MKIAIITQLTENDEILSHMAIHVWHLTKWTGSNVKTIFRSWGCHKCLCKRCLWLWHVINSWSHATQQEKLLTVILPFSTTQAYSTNTYITSIKNMMQNYKSKNSRMNHKCPRLSMLFLMHRIIINHVLQVESITILGQDIILRAAFFTEILHAGLNLVRKYKIQGPQITDKNWLVEPTMFWSCW